MSEKTQLYAGIVIALLLGAAIGWIAKPAPSIPTGGDTVAKSVYDEVVANLNAAQTEIADLESDVEDLTAELEAAQAEITALGKPFKVGMITGTGGLGDKSFNDGSYSALQRAYDSLGVEYDYVEPTSIAEYEGYQRDFAKSGEYGLIICIGFDQADALTIVAAEYPNQNFVLVDMVVENPNVASLTFRANEGSFLLGIVAAMKSEAGKLGFVGGMDIPLINDFYVGFKAGAEWAVPSIEVFDPVYVNDWGDPTKAKELAVGLVELGADGIFSAAGASGLGALQAADEQGVNGYGVDACQDYLNPHMFASMTKRVDNAVYEMILSAMVGKFQGGFYSGGLKEGWVGMCRLPSEEAYWEELFEFTHQPISDEIINKVLAGQNKVVSGEIVVPNGYE